MDKNFSGQEVFGSGAINVLKFCLGELSGWVVWGSRFGGVIMCFSEGYRSFIY